MQHWERSCLKKAGGAGEIFGLAKEESRVKGLGNGYF